MARLPVIGAAALVSAACGAAAGSGPSPASLPLAVQAEAPTADSERRAAAAALASLTAEHCTRCHDGAHQVDLRTLPNAGDDAAWQAIRSAVGSSEMPPPTKASPFPLDPSVRERFLLHVDTLRSAGGRASRPPHAAPLPADVWVAVVGHVAGPYLEARELDAVVRSNLGGLGGARHADEAETVPAEVEESLPGVGHLSQERIAHAVCRAFVGGEARRLPAARVALGDVDLASPRLDDGDATKLACRLARHVFETECSADDTKLGVDAFRAFERETRSTAESTVALCTAYLLSPRLFLEAAR